FPARLKEIREKRELSQSQLAEFIGVTQRQVSNYETGQEWPGPERLLLIAYALEVPMTDLHASVGRRLSRRSDAQPIMVQEAGAHKEMLLASGDKPFVSGQLAKFCCVVCARVKMTAVEIEEFTNEKIKCRGWRTWRVVDRALPPFSREHTPFPCPHD